MLHVSVSAIWSEAVIDLVPEAGSVQAGVPPDLQRQIDVVSVIAFNFDFINIVLKLLLLNSL